MSSVLRWTANGALVAIGCWLAADVASQFVAAAQPARSAERSVAPPSSPAAPDRSWAGRQVILDRNLFAGSTLEAAPPVARPGTFGEHAMLTWLLGQTQLLPKFEEDGQVVGLRVGAIGPGSLFEKIGLENGDVITEFNGIPMSSQAASAKILQEMVYAGEYHVVGRRPDGSERVWDFVR